VALNPREYLREELRPSMPGSLRLMHKRKVIFSVPLFFLLAPPYTRNKRLAPVWGSEFTTKSAALQEGFRLNRCWAKIFGEFGGG
jgi:hypothetical protein